MNITLYITKYCPYSIRTRIALAEKKISADIREAGDLEPHAIKKIAPDGIFPVLAEKNYIINNRKSLLIYIDERFPAPALMPNIVPDRIKIRDLLEEIDNEWYPVLDEVRKHKSEKKELKKIFKDFKETLLSQENSFSETEFFNSISFTLADCYIAALMICLEAEGFIINEEFGSIYEYKKRIFSRESVKKANIKGSFSESLLKVLRANR